MSRMSFAMSLSNCSGLWCAKMSSTFSQAFLKRSFDPFFSQSVWIPELFTRDYRTDWEKKGWKNLFKKACEKVDDILAHHKPEPLDKDIAKDIREIVKEADKELT